MEKKEKKITKKELMEKLKILKPKNKQQRNELVCVLIGHSRIQTSFMGYHDCGRCGARMGDTLAGYYPFGKEAVVIGHNCKVCRKNYKKCDWRDKLYVPDPFKSQ